MHTQRCPVANFRFEKDLYEIKAAMLDGQALHLNDVKVLAKVYDFEKARKGTTNK